MAQALGIIIKGVELVKCGKEHQKEAERSATRIALDLNPTEASRLVPTLECSMAHRSTPNEVAQNLADTAGSDLPPACGNDIQQVSSSLPSAF